MTYQLTVIYHQPDDPAAFDEHYASTHAPLAAQMPGLLSYTGTKPEAPADEYFVATLLFEDADAFAAAIGSDVGKAAVADVPNFASGGASMLTGPVETYA